MSQRFLSVTLLFVLVLSGCSQMRPGWGSRWSRQGSDIYSSADIDDLLRFGSAFARKSASARAEECKHLLRRLKDSPGPGVRLRLLSGRLLSESCGDRNKVIDWANGIDRDDIDDDVRWLMSAQIEALKRQNSVTTVNTGNRPAPPAPPPRRAATERPAAKPKAASSNIMAPASSPAPAAAAPAAAAAAAPAPAPAPAKSGKPTPPDVKVLREKLEAIRSMERKLDEATGGN